MRAFIGLLVLALCLSLSSVVWAIDTWPWSRGYLKWSWLGPADPAVTGFLLECGKVSGQYTVSKTYPPATMQIDQKDILTGTGGWYCRATPVYGATLGYPSAEYFFSSSGEIVLTGGTR